MVEGRKRLIAPDPDGRAEVSGDFGTHQNDPASVHVGLTCLSTTKSQRMHHQERFASCEPALAFLRCRREQCPG